MKSRSFYSQCEGDWNQLLWYDQRLDGALNRLTTAIHAFSRNPARGEAVQRAGAAVANIATQIGSSATYRQRRGVIASIGETGCWHVTIANMMMELGQTDAGIEITPDRLLRMLQDAKLGTLTGYVSRPFVDPLSILTRGQVQLAAFRDFGVSGAGNDSPELLALLAAADGITCCAVVNVCHHEFFDDGDSHYVLVAGRRKGGFCMLDPEETSELSFFGKYAKAFQVTLYRRVGT